MHNIFVGIFLFGIGRPSTDNLTTVRRHFGSRSTIDRWSNDKSVTEYKYAHVCVLHNYVGILYRKEFSRTWDKKIPPEYGFLFFVSVTAGGCLVQAVWYSFLAYCRLSNYDVSMQSAMFLATSEGCRDVKENIIGIFLFRMHISFEKRYEKNNQVPMLNPDRQISVSVDTMSHPSRGWTDWHSDCWRH